MTSCLERRLVESVRLKPDTTSEPRTSNPEPRVPITEFLPLRLRRRQQVTVVLHAGLGVVLARDAVRPVVLGDASADGVLVVEPHRQDAGPANLVAGSAAEASLALTELGERNVGRVTVVLCRRPAWCDRILGRRPAALVRGRRE